jgi:hypothetical protein
VAGIKALIRAIAIAGVLAAVLPLSAAVELLARHQPMACAWATTLWSAAGLYRRQLLDRAGAHTTALPSLNESSLAVLEFRL